MMKAWCINQSHSLLKARPCAGFSWKATTFYRLPRHALGAAVSTPNLPQQKAADVLRRVLHEVAVSLPSASHQKITGKPCKKTADHTAAVFFEFLQEGAVLEIRE